jgi:hypothetical protein
MANHRTSSESARCPLIRVIGASQNGLIALSSRELEVGSTFAVGLHVNLPDSGQSEFISAESTVVACQPEPTRDGQRIHRVALLFSDLSWSDRELLELMAYDERLLSGGREVSANPLDLSPQGRIGELKDSVFLN